jgi:hypothetical protein
MNYLRIIDEKIIEYLESIKTTLKIDERNVTISPYLVTEGFLEEYPNIIVDTPIPTGYNTKSTTLNSGYCDVQVLIHCMDKTNASSSDDKQAEIRVGDLAIKTVFELNKILIPHVIGYTTTFQAPQEIGNKIKNITIEINLKVLIQEC